MNSSHRTLTYPAPSFDRAAFTATLVHTALCGACLSYGFSNEGGQVHLNALQTLVLHFVGVIGIIGMPANVACAVFMLAHIPRTFEEDAAMQPIIRLIRTCFKPALLLLPICLAAALYMTQ